MNQHHLPAAADQSVNNVVGLALILWLLHDAQQHDEASSDYESDSESDSSEMTTPSPEYPVLVIIARVLFPYPPILTMTIYFIRTKPGARLQSKPVRTYGKRPATEPRGEPAAKKFKTGRILEQRISDGNDSTTSSSIYPRSTPTTGTGESCHSSDEDEDETPRPKSKGCSILSYFKPVPPTTPSSKSDATSVRSSMPPSPCQDRTRAAKRPRRMLRLRPIAPSSPSRPNEGKEPAETPTDDKENTPAPDGATNPPLKVSNSKPSSGVQTTINISSRASFSECKICDTVWNPFYADDEKYHKKRHAAVLRAKKRKADELV